AAGTGNLLAGLTNKRNLFASTLDKADVAIMKESAREGALSLFEGNIFQFDFLNDDLNGDKVPKALKDILNDTKKRKKLVIYINPPYAEATNVKTKTNTGKNRDSVSKGHKIHDKYFNEISFAANEIFALFLIRIKKEISGCILGQFSTLKTIQAPNFAKFRQAFCSELKSLFVVPAKTFDNVTGQFPIGFFIWDTSTSTEITGIKADIFNAGGEKIGEKTFSVPPEKRLLTDWLKLFHDKENENIAYLRMIGSDFQNNDSVFLTLQPTANDVKKKLTCRVTLYNLQARCVYFAVRHCIEHTWINHEDRYLFPNNDWQNDTGFHNNCLIFTLFHGKNRISADEGVNHWIPFTEDEVGAKTLFESDFMVRFIKGKIKHPENDGTLLQIHKSFIPTEPLHFSQEAQEVFNAGREIWRYYHQNAMGG
ncbi:MAG: hypothetical protein J6P29_03420, partial [Acetobacter sp.]|nr:hypothetical protein [Acetobacter sp.]